MHQSSIDRDRVNQLVINVLRSEAEVVRRLADELPAEVCDVVQRLLDCQGRVVVTGMGKMSAVARKMSATLCSTGTPAVFLHPSEALHGDLGIVVENDVFLAISNSGETNEIIQLIPFMKRHSVAVVSITGSASNSLAKHSDINIPLGIRNEADEITAAPTNSTTAALAMCDAIAVALVHLRGFTAQQFAKFHPGGQLGRKLLLRVKDLMHSGDRVPRVGQSALLREAIVIISKKTLGAGFIVDSNDSLVGIITDGDLRRVLQRDDNPLSHQVTDTMTAAPKTVCEDSLAVEALNLMEQNSITVLPVVTANQELIGAVHLHDLLRVGLA